MIGIIEEFVAAAATKVIESALTSINHFFLVLCACLLKTSLLRVGAVLAVLMNDEFACDCILFFFCYDDSERVQLRRNLIRFRAE